MTQLAHTLATRQGSEPDHSRVTAALHNSKALCDQRASRSDLPAVHCRCSFHLCLAQCHTLSWHFWKIPGVHIHKICTNSLKDFRCICIFQIGQTLFFFSSCGNSHLRLLTKSRPSPLSLPALSPGWFWRQATSQASWWMVDTHTYSDTPTRVHAYVQVPSSFFKSSSGDKQTCILLKYIIIILRERDNLPTALECKEHTSSFRSYCVSTCYSTVASFCLKLCHNFQLNQFI